MTGREFAKLRADYGLSQRTAAEALGVSEKTIWAVEHSDKVKPVYEMALKWWQLNGSVRAA